MKYSTDRHKTLVKKIRGLNSRRTDITKNNFVISRKLGVSLTTVINYMRGHITDPYLAEDIITQIEENEINNQNSK